MSAMDEDSQNAYYYSVLKGLKNMNITGEPVKKLPTKPKPTKASTSQPQPAVIIAPKEKSTLYWAIHIPELATVLDLVSLALSNNSDLIPNKEVHTTLLFVGRKPNEDEKVFLPNKDKSCNVMVSGYGITEDALSLRVESMVFTDSLVPVPTFQTVTQHITVALSKGTKAVDSYKAIDTNFVPFPNLVTLTGTLKQYFF